MTLIAIKPNFLRASVDMNRAAAERWRQYAQAATTKERVQDHVSHACLFAVRAQADEDLLRLIEGA